MHAFDLETCDALLLFDKDASEAAEKEFLDDNRSDPEVDAKLKKLREEKKLPMERTHVLLGMGGGTFKTRGLCINWLHGTDTPKVCLIARK